MTVEIRPAGRGDVEAVCAVHERGRAASYRDTPPGEPGEWRAVFAAALDGTDRTLLVATDGPDVIGLALTAPTVYGDLEQAAVGQLYQLAVDPHRWSQGVGTRLLTGAVASLARSGYADACLEVWAGNDRARAFYQRHGWRPDGSVRVAPGDLTYVRYVVRLTASRSTA